MLQECIDALPFFKFFQFKKFSGEFLHQIDTYQAVKIYLIIIQRILKLISCLSEKRNNLTYLCLQSLPDIKTKNVIILLLIGINK